MNGDHIRTRLDPLVSRAASIDPRATDRLADAIRYWQRQGTLITEGGVGLPTISAIKEI